MTRVGRTGGAAPADVGAAVMPPPALELAGLVKRFGTTTAVDHIDLAVPRGSFFGLVGPNGAGKTTSLSMAVGLLRPDGGTARVFGIDVWADPVAAKQLIGVLPDNLALPERLTGRELLTYLGRLRGLDRAIVAARAQELLEVLELAEAERTLVADYSAGMRKKITLATALLHTPRGSSPTPARTQRLTWSTREPPRRA
jgi:ABC-2 type transport system ATP-binding protein